MKSVKLGLFGRRFDDQYTFDFQGYLSLHDFNSAIGLFNEAVRQHPPPGHKSIWIGTLLTLWIVVAATVYILWSFLLLKENPYILLIMPAVMLLTAIVWVWRYRYLHSTFQRSLVELCSRINASENIRGVNYRLTKHGLDLHHGSERADSIFGKTSNGGGGHRRNTTTTCIGKTRYALVIEFDDRYRALQMQQQSLQPPEFVFCPHQSGTPTYNHVHPSYPPLPTTLGFNTTSSTATTAIMGNAPPPLSSDEKIQSPPSAPSSWTTTTLFNHLPDSNNKSNNNGWVDCEKQ
ncbi:hypothetical protein BDA99DRAFT_533036 [Phascolomyces articulosus]|uniref:Uncharacterized protein n=1 Tax=Phascolomyces articulosus TaxID=60185 RepID=A0AAD5KKN9_9FUNG|nr:hypothetical protein BDA99DRAFT_533036 [Phascolomyces articulosus]